ncbi:hypothetical protein [Fusobacterium sp.]|uniref:hypothetical protein n=1 Tax=Fusobacterium sp. TaxID=68766 RepID=UPI00396D03E4
MFLINSFMIVILFMLSLAIPVSSFILPVYKIKKMRTLTFRSKIFANLIAMGIIGAISPKLLVMYFIFFIPIEVLYYYFNNMNPAVEKFDRIVIISLTVTVLMSIFVYLVRDDLQNGMNLIGQFYEQYLDLNPTEVKAIFESLKSNIIFYIFDYSILCVFFLYICVDLNHYEKWKISFEWLLLYIVPFFLVQIFKISNLYTINILKVGELIFTFYGIKTTYGFLAKYIRFKFLNNFVAFALAIQFPFPMFLIGVIGGFFTKKNNK